MFGARDLQTSVGTAHDAARSGHGGGEPVQVLGTLFLRMIAAGVLSLQGPAPRFTSAATVGAPVLHSLAIGWAGRSGHARRERSESAS